MDLARPLMHAVSDAHGVSVYLSKVLGPSSLLLDWVGAAFCTDLYVTVGRQYPGPVGASGVIIGAFGSGNETELEALFLSPSWELLLVLTAAGHAHDVDGDAVGPLSRTMQSAAARLSESARLLRLG